MNQKDEFLTYLGQTSPNPLKLEIERSEGVFLFGPDNKRYFDLISGISVMNVGHRHPKVLEAIRTQLEKHLHVMAYGEYVQEPVTRFAKNLSAALPEKLSTVYFVNSGTEALEAATKLAKRITGRVEMVACRGSYHGNTQGALSLSGNEVKKNAFRPLIPGTSFIRFNHAEDLDKITSSTAAVVIEPVQGDAGVRIPDSSYLSAVAQKCQETGALLIFDEVQTGMGRTGKLFAFEHFGVVPDILCLAKALGGGLPLGAVVSSRENLHAFTHNPMLGHITTFGGNPLSCVAGDATLEILQSGVTKEVEEKGKYFEELLQHPRIVEIRRIGLMMAIEFDNEEIVAEIVASGIHHGVITYFFLSNRNSFRLAPPLTISMQEIKEACEILQEVFQKVLK